MHYFQNLRVWQEAMKVASEIYELTRRFPSEERFGLTQQLRRSSVSIPSNIAEGAGRNTTGEFNHFLGIANGSSCEAQTQLILAERLGYITELESQRTVQQIEKVKNMNFKLQRSIQHKANT